MKNKFLLIVFVLLACMIIGPNLNAAGAQPMPATPTAIQTAAIEVPSKCIHVGGAFVAIETNILSVNRLNQATAWEYPSVLYLREHPAQRVYLRQFLITGMAVSEPIGAFGGSTMPCSKHPFVTALT